MNKSIKVKMYFSAILFLTIVVLGIFNAVKSYIRIDFGTIKFCTTLYDLNKTFLLYNSNKIILPCEQLCIWGTYSYVYGYYANNRDSTNYFIFDAR